MSKYSITLKGPNTKGTAISGALLSELLQVVVAGTKGALRLRFDGRSTARGSEPAWLKKAGDFTFLGLSEGSTVLELDCPPVNETAPERFAQLQLFENSDPNLSAYDLFQRALKDAAEGRRDTDTFDDALLGKIAQLNTIFENGIESIDFRNGSVATQFSITEKEVETVKQLQSTIPSPQQVRIAGKVDTIRHSDRMFVLILKNDDTVRGVATESVTDNLAGFFGREVIIGGLAVFRPSGSLLRIEASQISFPSAEENMDFWSKAPKPLSAQFSSLRKPQTNSNGLNAIWGKWPSEDQNTSNSCAGKS